MNDPDVFQAERRRLFSIAYRMLGGASDAEDVLQDAWLRYRGVDAAAVRSPRAFATTIVTRLCLDRLKAARTTREEYVGPWLPEPILASAEGPEAILQRTESVTLAFLVLLDTLSPQERAVFLLKEIFDYDHHEIGEMLDVTPEHSRQLLHRAKARVAEGRPRFDGTAASRRQVAERFAAAMRSGDSSALSQLLAADVEFLADGGGKATAARRPLFGYAEVHHALLGFHRTAVASGLASRASMTVAEVNGEPGVILRVDDRIDAIYVISVRDGAIAAIRAIRNPDKFAYIARQLDNPE